MDREKKERERDTSRDSERQEIMNEIKKGERENR